MIFLNWTINDFVFPFSIARIQIAKQAKATVVVNTKSYLIILITKPVSDLDLYEKRSVTKYDLSVLKIGRLIYIAYLFSGG